MTGTSDRDLIGRRMERAAIESIVASSDLIRALWALRRLDDDHAHEDDHEPLTHDGSILPDDVPRMGTACDDEPPESHGPVR